MNVLAVGTAWLLSGFGGGPGSLIQPKGLDPTPIPILKELGPELSKGATITLPAMSAKWANLTARAAFPRIDPYFRAIVEVATEEDVQKTIGFANRYELPFLTVSGAHGWTTDLNRECGGIQINMRQMNSVQLNPLDGRTATAGGGILQYEMTKQLAQHGKQAVTGLCECVSVIGPLMGGGHSVLQGHYGFASDNLVSARLVLSNGSIVEASDSHNHDLFWAIRGAGHNFGIVTSFDVLVHDIPPGDGWTLFQLVYTHDKLEQVFDMLNDVDGSRGDHPVQLAFLGGFARMENVDSNSPVVSLTIFYEGSEAEGGQHAAPFRAIGPAIDTTTTGISYQDLYVQAGVGMDGPICRKNENILGFPNGLTSWNSTAMRLAFNLFADITADETFATSLFLLESYGMKAVHAVDPKSSAVPLEERENGILVAPVFWWAGDDEEKLRQVTQYGEKIRAAVFDSGTASNGEYHAYINYAIGGETMEETYGYEPWRLQKLRELKKEWDPRNQFGFYAPII